MLEINKFIETYGDQISSQLNITGTQLYDKLIWYTRIDALISFLGLIFFILINFVGIKIYWSVIKKNFNRYDRNAIMLIGIFAILLISLLLQQELSAMVGKVFFPEWWIIDQLITGFQSQ